MWYRILLLLIYVIALFLLSRVLELFAWCQSGTLTNRFVDPVALSVRKLKALLDARGVSYQGLLEKTELSELVEKSGNVQLEEVEIAAVEDGAVTNFTTGLHFYEEVEDKKDSVWIILVKTDHIPATLLSDDDWKAVRKKASTFGIRSGFFDCSLDKRLCDKKSWTSPRLVLALPESFRTKANVAIHTYKGAVKAHLIYTWMMDKLAEQVTKIKTYEELKDDWLTYNKEKQSEIRTVIFTELTTLPLIFAALSFKFPGRVRFGSVDTRKQEGKSMLKKFKQTKSSLYLVITAERHYAYGYRPGELLRFSVMERFFRFLYPEVNDLFLLSLFMSNILSCLEFILCPGSMFRRFVRLIWCFVKYNMVVIFMWLPIIALFQLPILQPVVDLALKWLRCVNNTYLASLVRTDFSLYADNIHLFLVTSLAYFLIIGIIKYKYRGADQQNNEFEWWNIGNLRSGDNIFNPISRLARGSMGFGLYPADVEESIEFLNGQFMSPSLWLRPMINPDYMKSLPTWVFLQTEEYTVETSVNKSGTENDTEKDEIQMSACPMCAKCHALHLENIQRLKNKVVPPNLSTDATETAEMSRADEMYMHNHNANNVSSAIGTNLDTHLGVGNMDHDAQVWSASPHAQLQPTQTENKNLIHPNCNTSDACQRMNCYMPLGFVESTQCAICLEMYQKGIALLCGLPCGHVFHEDCLLPWLSRDNHFCPLCRWPSYKCKSCHVSMHLD